MVAADILREGRALYMREHMPAYIRQHTLAYAIIREHTPAYASIRNKSIYLKLGTLYMVAADIFREGRALYADHLALTEHYPISEHARFCTFVLTQQ
jgi:hypothetical protein